MMKRQVKNTHTYKELIWTADFGISLQKFKLGFFYMDH